MKDWWAFWSGIYNLCLQSWENVLSGKWLSTCLRSFFPKFLQRAAVEAGFWAWWSRMGRSFVHCDCAHTYRSNQKLQRGLELRCQNILDDFSPVSSPGFSNVSFLRYAVMFLDYWSIQEVAVFLSYLSSRGNSDSSIGQPLCDRLVTLSDPIEHPQHPTSGFLCLEISFVFSWLLHCLELNFFMIG